MATSNLIRWGGLAALAGGVLWVVTDVAFFVLIGDQPESIVGPTSTWVILAGLFLAGGILILLGLVGLYTFQAAEAGVVGLIAFLVAFIGTGLVVGALWAATFVAPTVAGAAPELVDAEPSGMLAIGFMFTFALEALGWVLFGLASLRAAVLPRGPAVLLMVGAILSFVLGFFEIPFGDIVLEVALAWMGYAVWTRAGETATDA